MNTNLLLAFVCVVALAITSTAATPLDDYVKKFDPTYKFEVVNNFRSLNTTVYNIKLTSQTWMHPGVVSTTVWMHWLQLRKDFQTGLMLIDGGGNLVNGGLRDPPTSIDPLVGQVCQMAQTVVARLGQIPNQPIRFASDPSGMQRNEDNLIAWTWREFLHNTSNPEWLARLPMTKAAVRAMDTIQTFIRGQAGYEIKNFAIAGASKRGWTTWTTAAVDSRIVAMIPMVLPMGNLTPLIDSMWRVTGEWSFALSPYVNADVLRFLGTPEFYAMSDIIDPMVYFNRWNGLPKYVVYATGDEFFLPDSPRFWWDKLPEPKLQFNMPNAEHTMLTAPITDVAFGINTFLQTVMRKMPLPEFHWKVNYSNSTASIEAWATGPVNPKSVWMYHATTLSATKRDFRLITCTKSELRCLNPVLWDWKQLQETFTGSRRWIASMPAPKAGWTGFLIEAIYEGQYNDGDPVAEKKMRVTTEVNIVPDVYPFPSCHETNNCQPPIPWDPNRAFADN